ncbi:MAG: glycosyltransferase family 4 protein [Bacteroidetes bacterium]|nr:glycosyltransferase family 4 protein [Bacteroidota bacterium]
MPKILFIGAHRINRSPSQRFRFEQYFSFLEEQGYTCQLSYLLDAFDDKYFYSSGNWIFKFIILIKAIYRRLRDICSAKSYDAIFIQREAFMTGSIFFEKMLKRVGKKIVFDFDDSIWLMDISEANKSLKWLKNPAKTAKLIALSDTVIAGNAYLAEYARKYNPNVTIIPTTIDLNYHYSNRKSKNRICIGWTGSHTTIKHFELAVSFLRQIKNKYGDSVYFKVIGDETYKNDSLGINGVKWSLKDEMEQLQEIDIGIMPLPDDEWSKGKCGFKGLQYMALEIPAVMSPVGMNTEIINNGVNGYLASTDEQWVEVLSKLIDSKGLREQMGKEARKTIVENYSVDSQKQNYLRILNDLIKS